MKVKFPDGLGQYMTKKGRLFIANYHDDRTIDLALYDINKEAEFIDAGFTLIPQAQTTSFKKEI